MNLQKMAIAMGVILVLIGIVVSTTNVAAGWMIIVVAAGSAAWVAVKTQPNNE